jgi:hypothetical protein
MIQGGNDGYTYRGMAFFDFAAIRQTNLTYYPTNVRVRLKSHVAYGRTVRLWIGQGIAKDSFPASNPSPVTDTYLDVACDANGWVEFNTNNANWLSAIVNDYTTCLYIYKSSSDSDYWECDGAKTANVPELYIDWTIRTTACTAPTSFTVSPSIFETTISLAWSGASGGANNSITGYEIQYSLSADGNTWSGWGAWQTISTASASGSSNDTPGISRGEYEKYQIRTIGSAGASYYSGWVESPSVRKNRLPNTPSVNADATNHPESTYTISWSEDS